jgi:hypothetical protein
LLNCKAAGSYNGWFVGMTYSDATAAASTGSCGAQNNLDYVSQLFNGWMQGRDGTVIGQYCEFHEQDQD